MAQKEYLNKQELEYTIQKILTLIEDSGFSGEYSDLTGAPTKLSDFANDTEFITKTVTNLVNYYTKTEVNNLIGEIKTIQIEVVNTLPATGESNVIYLVPKQGQTSESNLKDEYIWNAKDNQYEIIGDTTIDLSNYITKDMAPGYDDILTKTEAASTYIKDSDLVPITQAEIDAMFNV